MGPVTRGRPVVGSLSAHARPTYRPERSQPRLGEKPSPGGLPVFLHSSRRTPLRMEEKWDLRSGGFGPEGSEGLPARTPGARTTGPGVGAPWRQRAAYCWMRVSCRVKGWRGHSQGDRGHLAFREFPGKFPAQAPGPQVYPAHSVCARLGVLLASVPQRKSRGPLGGREGSCVHGQVPRDPVELL